MSWVRRLPALAQNETLQEQIAVGAGGKAIVTGSLKGEYLLATPKASGLARWMKTRFRTLSQHRLWSEQSR
jgi:hypothetical protein